MKKIFLSIGHEETEALVCSIEDIEVIDNESNLDILENLIEFAKMDCLIINRLLDTDGKKLLKIAEKASKFKIKVIMLIKNFNGFEEKKLIASLVNTGVYSYIAINGLDRDKLIAEIEHYPETFDFSLLKIETDNIETYNIEIDNKETIREIIKGTIIVAFAGADTNIGCTHAAYSTAYYLSRQGYKTAYVELCDDPIFYSGFREDSSVKEIDGGYNVEKNLDMYVKYLNNNVEFGLALSSGYEYLILDLGYIAAENTKNLIEPKETIREMERANVPVLVGAGSKWQLENIVNVARLGHKNWRLYINFADKSNEKAIKNALAEILDNSVYLSPYAPNCFKKYEEQDTFLENFLNDVLPKKHVKTRNPINRIFKRT